MAVAKISPVPAAKPAAGALPQHHQERLPVPVFTVHSGEHKDFVQFKSDFKDAKRDVTTQGACCSTIPHRAGISPAVSVLGVHRYHHHHHCPPDSVNGNEPSLPRDLPLGKIHHTTENSEPELNIFCLHER